MNRTAGILLVVLPVALAGCSDGETHLPPEWRGRDLREPGWGNVTLEAEWTLVLEYPLSSGAKVEWDWFTEAEQRGLYFQVVLMEGNRPVKMVARHVSEEESSMVAPKAGVYQVIWMNDGFLPVNFHWKASEGFSQRTYPPNEGPGCVLLTWTDACLAFDGSEPERVPQRITAG